MTKFIRHPSGIPVRYSLLNEEETAASKKVLSEINGTGLCFNTSAPLELDTLLRMEIRVRIPPFEAEAIVVWCNKIENHSQYEIGIRFLKHDSDFNLRMVEQVCQIEIYKNDIFETEKRRLTSEEAAAEWVHKHAHNFPQ